MKNNKTLHGLVEQLQMVRNEVGSGDACPRKALAWLLEISEFMAHHIANSEDPELLKEYGSKSELMDEAYSAALGMAVVMGLTSLQLRRRGDAV